MPEFTWDPDFPVDVETAYKTLVSKFENGFEQRRAVRSGSIKTFKLTFTNRTATEMQAVKSFFDTKKGQLTAFTFTNPNDSTTYTVRYSEDSFVESRKSVGIYDFRFDLIQVL